MKYIGKFMRKGIGMSILVLAALIAAPFIYGGAYLEERFNG